MRIVVAAATAAVRAAAVVLLDNGVEFQARAVSTVGELEAAVAGAEIDVLLLGTRFGQRGWRGTIPRVRRLAPALKIVVTTVHGCDGLDREAREQGALGCVSLGGEPTGVVHRLRSLLQV